MTVSALSCLVAEEKDNTGSACARVRVQRPSYVAAELIFSSLGHRAWNRRVRFLCVNLQFSAGHVWPFKAGISVRKKLSGKLGNVLCRIFNSSYSVIVESLNRTRPTGGRVAFTQGSVFVCAINQFVRVIYSHTTAVPEIFPIPIWRILNYKW